MDHQANKGGTMGKQSRASRREVGLSAAPGGTVAVYNECFPDSCVSKGEDRAAF